MTDDKCFQIVEPDHLLRPKPQLIPAVLTTQAIDMEGCVTIFPIGRTQKHLQLGLLNQEFSLMLFIQMLCRQLQ